MKTSQKIYLPFKRVIGFFGSIIAIVLSAVLIWWWVLPINIIVTKGHPFFVQERYGKHKKVFKLLKFRTMKLDTDPNLPPSEMTVEAQRGHETKFGYFLRKTSFDETLQFFNILFGQMAFIGPRPGAAHNEEQLVVEREQYTPNAFEVKPGMSGLAQIRTKREHKKHDKAYWDHIYIKKMSLWFDTKIFIYTPFLMIGIAKGR